MFSESGRLRKARTMITVLQTYSDIPLNNLVCLDVGGSTGIIDYYLADYFKFVTGIDIDSQAIGYAKENFSKENLVFEIGDAMSLQYNDATFDVVICSQVYEHVPEAEKMMEEIHRVLKPGGICYFAANNRFMLHEPHYDLPFLSVIPRITAHLYLRISGKGSYYYEKHLSYWGLKRLVKDFSRVDYTLKLIENPKKFSIEYMIRPNSTKAKLAAVIAKNMIWLVPGYIWILVK